MKIKTRLLITLNTLVIICIGIPGFIVSIRIFRDADLEKNDKDIIAYYFAAVIAIFSLTIVIFLCLSTIKLLQGIFIKRQLILITALLLFPMIGIDMMVFSDFSVMNLASTIIFICLNILSISEIIVLLFAVFIWDKQLSDYLKE
jgi:hypothetical protein